MTEGVHFVLHLQKMWDYQPKNKPIAFALYLL